MRTLIVDDDDVCRTSLRIALEPYGPIVEVVTGREAVESVRDALLADQRFDLVTLDIMMPDMDGQTALMAIRNLELVKGIAPGKGARVLMTTALNSGRSVLDAFREQCDGYLIKPLELEKLYLELSRLGLITL